MKMFMRNHFWIMNALLLTDYTYLSNDSSFSVSVEDNVEVIVQDNVSSVTDGKSLDKAEKSLYFSSISDTDQTESSKPSLSFEAQVVSPEFTFYDSTRSSIDGKSIKIRLPKKYKTDSETQIEVLCTKSGRSDTPCFTCADARLNLVSSNRTTGVPVTSGRENNPINRHPFTLQRLL